MAEYVAFEFKNKDVSKSFSDEFEKCRLYRTNKCFLAKTGNNKMVLINNSSSYALFWKGVVEGKWDLVGMVWRSNPGLPDDVILDNIHVGRYYPDGTYLAGYVHKNPLEYLGTLRQLSIKEDWVDIVGRFIRPETKQIESLTKKVEELEQGLSKTQEQIKELQDFVSSSSGVRRDSSGYCYRHQWKQY